MKAASILFFFLFISGSGFANETNLITNPGFETDMNVQGLPFIPTGWSPAQFQNIYVELLDDAPNEPVADATHGSYALKMFGTFSGLFNQTLLFQNNIAAVPGTSYDACIEMFVSSADAISGPNLAFMRLAFFDGGGVEVGGVNSEYITGASPQDVWNNLCVTEIAPPGTTTMGMFLFFQQDLNASGAVFYDNASICVTPAIPTLKTWGLVILGLLLAIGGIIFMVNTKKRDLIKELP